TVPGVGTHVVYNALAAIAAARRVGLSEDEVLHALAALPATERRFEPKVAAGITVFDDTYNMNPESARAALRAMSGLPGSGRRIAVFGEMLELGEASESLHRELGAQVEATGQDILVAVGAGAAPIAEGAIVAGMPAQRVHRVADVESARLLLLEMLRPEDRVVCKASRRVALDRLVDDLLAELQAGSQSTSSQAAAGAARRDREEGA
ncbi:MAG: UDP-N-acetylmuramoyl-tripeptide--D-alanyl-D-alanine ligase, partial [Planctomycetes bacterium]|nr:UDP-N-acetylmuramoyl-tripeptide--D-alanyl-D-alanine ligase [Planctomycetota bacterium]